MMMNGPLRCELTGELLPERQLVVMDHLRPVIADQIEAGPPITLGPTRSSIVQVARSLEQASSSPITSRRVWRGENARYIRDPCPTEGNQVKRLFQQDLSMFMTAATVLGMVLAIAGIWPLEGRVADFVVSWHWAGLPGGRIASDLAGCHDVWRDAS